MVIQPAVTVAKTHADIQKTTTSHWSSRIPACGETTVSSGVEYGNSKTCC